MRKSSRPGATCKDDSDNVDVRVADVSISFTKQHVGGTIEMQGPRRKLGE